MEQFPEIDSDIDEEYYFMGRTWYAKNVAHLTEQQKELFCHYAQYLYKTQSSNKPSNHRFGGQARETGDWIFAVLLSCVFDWDELKTSRALQRVQDAYPSLDLYDLKAELANQHARDEVNFASRAKNRVVGELRNFSEVEGNELPDLYDDSDCEYNPHASSDEPLSKRNRKRKRAVTVSIENHRSKSETPTLFPKKARTTNEEKLEPKIVSDLHDGILPTLLRLGVLENHQAISNPTTSGSDYTAVAYGQSTGSVQSEIQKLKDGLKRLKKIRSGNFEAASDQTKKELRIILSEMVLFKDDADRMQQNMSQIMSGCGRTQEFINQAQRSLGDTTNNMKQMQENLNQTKDGVDNAIRVAMNDIATFRESAKAKRKESKALISKQVDELFLTLDNLSKTTGV